MTRVVLGQLLDHGPPGVGAVADAVDQEERGPRAGLHEGPSVPVDGAVLHGEGALAPHPGR